MLFRQLRVSLLEQLPRKLTGKLRLATAEIQALKPSVVEMKKRVPLLVELQN
jgi:hypothetical protein